MARGSIRPRSRSTYEIRYDLPKGPDGKRRVKQETVKGNKKAAQAVLTQRLANLDKPEAQKASEKSVRECYQAFLKERADNDLRPGTVKGYNNLFRNYLLPECGEISLAGVCREDLQRVIQRMVGSGLGSNTIKVNSLYLKGFFSWLVRAQWLTESPATGLTVPAVSHTSTVEILSPEEVREVLGLLEGTPYWLPTFLGLYTGMRPGEVLGLSWEDIDLKNGKVFVRHTLNTADKAQLLSPPKTRTSRRSIAVSPEVVRVLRDRQRQMPDSFWEETTTKVGNRLTRVIVPVEFRQVCAQKDGRIVKAGPWGVVFRSKLHHAGLRPIRLHDLRHTHASLLLLKGVPMVVVSRRLGHASITTTIDLYGHLLSDSDPEAALRFEGIIDAEL